MHAVEKLFFNSLFNKTPALILLFETIIFDSHYCFSEVFSLDDDQEFKMNICEYSDIKKMPTKLFIRLCFLKKFENEKVDNPLINFF